MKVIIVGENAKEQALASLLEHRGMHEVLVLPGNPGTRQFEQSVEDLPEQYDPADVLGTAAQINPDLIILCDEDLIRKGEAEKLRSRGWDVLAPDLDVCALIDDKPGWAKIMQENDIPVADFCLLNSIEEAREFEASHECPYVLKEIEGKKRFGIPYSEDEASELLESWFKDGPTRVMVSEFEEGRRFNLPVLVWKARVAPLLPYVVYRGVYEHEDDPQAKGMGAICTGRGTLFQGPSDEAVNRILVPFLKEIQKRGYNYNGLMTGEFILTDHGLTCVNLKYGLSETGAVSYFQLLDTDFVKVWKDLKDGVPAAFAYRPKTAASVVMAGKDYPKKESHDAPIEIDDDFEGILSYNHVKSDDDHLLSDGGRVLVVTRLGDSLAEAAGKACESLESIHCDDLIYRTDIGWDIYTDNASELSDSR